MSLMKRLQVREGGLSLIIKTVIGNAVLAVIVSYISHIFEQTYQSALKGIVAVLAAIVIAYAFRENRTAIDKIRNYDYSKFNLKKRQEYSEKSNALLNSGKDKDIYNIVPYVFFLIIPFLKLKSTDIEWVDLYITSFLGLTPITVTILYLIFFNERKTIAERWLMRLDEQKRIEESREKFITRLRKAIDEESGASNNRSQLEITEHLEQFKDKSKTNGAPKPQDSNN